MNVVAVSDQDEEQQQKCDQQQSSRFRRVNRMPTMLQLGFGRQLGQGHADIVALPREEHPGARLALRSMVIHYGVVVHAFAAKQCESRPLWSV